MSTTAQKHRKFIAEPMSDKAVTELAGIGKTLGQKLSSAVHVLYPYFLSILSKFNPNFIQVQSRFFPDFIQILSTGFRNSF